VISNKNSLELREKAYLQKRDTEKSELSKDRKLSQELRKHPHQRLTREQSPVKKYILAALYGHVERYQNQGSIDKDSTTVKVYASKHSNFSFKINDALAIRWDELNRRFVLRCPYHFKMEWIFFMNLPPQWQH